MTVKDTEWIMLKNGAVWILGSSFQADIFYQWNNLISQKYASFTYQNNILFYKTEEMDEAQELEYGEELRIGGLWIKYLGKIMIFVPFEGDFRLSTRDRRNFDAHRRS